MEREAALFGSRHLKRPDSSMTKPAPAPDQPPRARDRDATARGIVEAAKLVLAEDGFQSFGVNAIARRAGCDKQLIYRYFGGLDGVADAIGADLAEELRIELTPLSTASPPETYAALMERLAFGWLELLKGNRVMQQITAWEAAMPSPLVTRMIEARSHRLTRWMHEMRGDLVPPADIDAPATNALIIASIQQLVLSSTATGEFAGMPLRSDENWSRVKAALSALIHAIYPDTHNPGKPPTRP
jgi:AcrR family transcriptional regulator